MAMGAPMGITMSIEPHHVLTLSQWLSPAYPVGAFSYSHGIEWAIISGEVTSSEALKDWLEDILRYGSGYTDVIFLAAAYAAQDSETLRKLNAKARAFAPSKERLLETTAQGAAFAEVTKALSHDMPGAIQLCYPIAVGYAAGQQALPLQLTAQMYLQAFVSNLVSAGMRAIPIGQTVGQALIKELAPLCQDVANAAIEVPLSALASTAFLADIASMNHETQYSRIFRS